MISRLSSFFLDLQVRLICAISGFKSKLADERGDTNFISIAIILIVVIGIAVVFIGFGQTITGWINSKIGELKEALGMG